MKTILVDAIGAFIEEGTGIFQEMFDLLESYPNPKIILTGANDQQMDEFGLHDLPYELFTLKHNPEKSDPEYYRMMLDHFQLSPADVVYFEHGEKAKQSAESLGIKTFFYDSEKRDLVSLKKFLDETLVDGK
jgi:FMN phosphatase YigB (HAD superfamily)